MNSKTSIVLSAVAIAAVVLLFASGSLVADHQALAYHYHHGHYHHGHYHHGHYHHGHYHHGHYHY
jgi:hypothetical protein